jgi:hypothetical protein
LSRYFDIIFLLGQGAVRVAKFEHRDGRLATFRWLRACIFVKAISRNAANKILGTPVRETAVVAVTTTNDFHPAAA